MTSKNTQPETVYELLRAALNCNKSQLAARLGISRITLNTWEKAQRAGEPESANTRRAIAELLRVTLRASNADEYLIDKK